MAFMCLLVSASPVSSHHGPRIPVVMFWRLRVELPHTRPEKQSAAVIVAPVYLFKFGYLIRAKLGISAQPRSSSSPFVNQITQHSLRSRSSLHCLLSRD